MGLRLTDDGRQDLRLRLLEIAGQLVPASDKQATDRVINEVVDRLPVSADAADDQPEAAHVQAELAALRVAYEQDVSARDEKLAQLEANAAAHAEVLAQKDELQAANQALSAELTEARALLEAATQPPTDPQP